MAVSNVSDALCTQLDQTESLLRQVYHGCAGLDGLRHPETSKLVKTYYEIERKLVKSFPDHPGSLDLVKVDRLGADQLWRYSNEVLKELEPDYCLLKEVGAVMNKNSELLASIAEHMAPFSLDYTAGILKQYMQLFCMTTRLFLLLRFYPSKLIIQLYSLVQGHASLRDKADRRQEVADRKDMVQLVSAFDKPIPRLQEYFKSVTPRISQVLDQIVAPVLLAFATARDTQESQILNPLRLPETDIQGQERMPVPAAIRGLQLLPKLQDWAIFGVLICPGAVAIPKVVQMIRKLLETNFWLQIYWEYGDWVHALYDAYVQPTLVSQYKSVKGSTGFSHRKALKGESKDVIDNALSVARATCMQEHCARRNLAQQSLEQFLVLMKADISQLPYNLQSITAALTYGKSEVLWYFRNVNEVLPTGVLQTLQTQPLRESSTDPSVSGLIAAIHAMHDLLLQYRTAVQAFVIDTIHTLVEEKISPVLVQLATTGPQAHSRPVVAAVQDMASIIEHFEALQLPNREQNDGVADLRWARAHWNSLTGSLFSSGAVLTAAELDSASGNSGVLYFMNQCLELCEYVDGFHHTIQRTASLSELYDFPEKLVACMRSTVQGPAEGALFSSAWLYVLSCFQYRQGDSVHEQPFSMAVRLGDDYMKGIADKVKTLLLRISEAHNRELAAPLTVSASYARSQNAAPTMQPAPPMAKSSKVATFTSATLSKAATLKNRVLAPTATAPVYQPGQESLPANRGSLAPLEDSQTALTNLGQSLAQAPAIQLAPTYVMVPAEFLRSAVQDAFKYQITQLAFADKEIQRPTVLAGEVKRLISLVHYIAPLMGLHASVLVQEALVSCACTAPGSDRAQAFQQDALGPSRPQSQQGSRADKQQDMKPEGQHQAAPPVPVVSSIAEWYMTTVVRDHRNIGVSISKARRSFVSLERPLDIALYASYEELRAVCQTWGLYGVQELALRSRSVLAEAFSTLDSVMRMHMPLLQRLKAEYLDHQTCYEACRAASSSLRDMQQALQAVRTAARCLYLRLLLSDAAKTEFAAHAPVVAGFFSGASQPDAEYSSPDTADMFDLPRCNSNATGGLSHVHATVDPALMQLIEGNEDPQCVQSTAFMAAVPAPDVTDKNGIMSSADAMQEPQPTNVKMTYASS
ncbi:hypothetical protein WJX79_009350 [Trebouxia sp. C0005]